MKHKFWPALLIGIFSSFILSCTEDPVPVKDGIRIPVSLSCEPLDTMPPPSSRSSHPDAAPTMISNVNYYLFRNGVLEGQEYFENAGNISVALPDKDASYNLYLLTNVGERRISDSTKEDDMDEKVHIDYYSRENYFSTISSCGFPMAGIIKGFSSESGTEHTVRRLTHTLYVKMNTSGLNTTKMEFTGIKIRQAPRDVFPFAAESRAQYVMEGDAADLSGGDIERLNAGETVTLYLLENMRGNLIPGNTSWKNKVPERISPESEKSLASYIEFTARAETITATYGNNIYRAYLGSGPSDFNVRRSTSFIMTNSFTNDMIVNEDWRIEGDTPSITAQLAFVDTRYTKETSAYPDDTGDNQYRPFRKISAFYTMNGFTSVYYIYRSDPRIEYTLSMEATNAESMDCSSHVTYRTKRIDDNFTSLIVDTTYPVETDSWFMTGNPSYSAGKSVTFKIRSADGVIEDSLICKVLTYPSELNFRYEGVSETEASNDGGQLKMYFCNPLGLRIEVDIKGTVKGYLTYKPNGTAFGSKTLYPETNIITGNRYAFNGTQKYSQYVIPVTGEGSRVDNYDDRTSAAGAISELDGFYRYFRKIWNTTGWDSYTKYNGSNGYSKHACPQEMTLDIKIRFSSPNSRRLFPHSYSGNVLKIPVHFRNLELKHDSGLGAYYGAGTDFGFIWHQHDNEAFPDYVTYKYLKSSLSPDKTYYTGENQLPVHVTVNGTDKWKTEGIGIPCSEVYDESYYSGLGTAD